MTAVAAVVLLGEPALIGGYVLAGARLMAAETADQVRAAWQEVRQQSAVVVLTPSAAHALEAELGKAEGPLTVVMPS